MFEDMCSGGFRRAARSLQLHSVCILALANMNSNQALGDVANNPECQSAQIDVTPFEDVDGYWFWPVSNRRAKLLRGKKLVGELVFRHDRRPFNLYPVRSTRPEFPDRDVFETRAAGLSYEFLRRTNSRAVYWNILPGQSGFITKTMAGGTLAQIYAPLDRTKQIDLTISYSRAQSFDDVFLDIACIIQSESYRRVASGH
jgi:hypothetical protein